MAERKFITVDTKTTEVLQYGSPEGRPVLFFHGFGASAACLPPDAASANGADVNILAINRPGTGGSSYYKPPGFSGYIHDTAALLDRLGLTRVHLIGWSAGGLFAQAFAGWYPERVRSLSLVSSAIPFYNRESRKALPLKWKVLSRINKYVPQMGRTMFKSIARQLLQDPDQVLRDSVAALPDADQAVLKRPGAFDVFSVSTRESFGKQGYGPFFDMQALCSGAAVPLQRISAPVTIWHGSEDLTWPADFARYLHRAIKGSQLRIVEGEGHLLYLTQWDQILRQAVQGA